MRALDLREIFTTDDLMRMLELGEAKRICKVIKPRIKDIEKAVGGEVDPMFLSYCVEHALPQIAEAMLAEQDNGLLAGFVESLKDTQAEIVH